MPNAGDDGAAGYDDCVFVNCPFDDEYQSLFEALIFAVLAFGLKPRCALEAFDGGTVRITKIIGLIGACRWGIHDISRTELNEAGLPRFNMPFELGLFIGASRFGNPEQQRKGCIVLDRAPYRYQAFLSDIAGQDIVAHQGSPDRAIAALRQWFATERPTVPLPGGAEINKRYVRFRTALPLVLDARRLASDEVTFRDYASIATEWLRAESPGP